MEPQTIERVCPEVADRKRENPLSLSIFGMGYVGAVTAACFAHMGHRVIGVDINPAKVEILESGRSPIVEAGINELIAEGFSACRLHATTDPQAAVHQSDVSFICVGTPSIRNGRPDLSHVEHVCSDVGSALRSKQQRHTVVVRSTILPGTTEGSIIPALEKASGLRAGCDFSVCYNPEFMREGNAVNDFLQPACTVLGAREPRDLIPVRELYRNVPGNFFETSLAAAEMSKYVANAFHALKVSFANEIGTLCKHLDVDTEAVVRILTSDNKLNISAAYLSPGFAFGGSCLPKDLRAISHRAKELDICLPLLDCLPRSNSEHLDRAAELILQTNKTKIAMIGLSFKAATDDLRESPHVRLVKQLLGEGRQIRIWDANVYLGRLVGSNRQYIEETIPHIGSLLCSSLDEVLDQSESIVIGTRELDRETLKKKIRPEQIVIDLVNLETGRRLEEHVRYEGLCW